MKFAMSTALGPVLGAGTLLGTLASCSSTGKVKDEGAYTTGKSAPKETEAGKSKGTKVGGSVGVFTEVGNTSRTVR